MTPNASRLVAAALLATALAGCGSRSDTSTTTPPPTTVQLQEDMLGTGFGIAFRQDQNAIPVVPLDSDVIAANLTADPVALK